MNHSLSRHAAEQIRERGLNEADVLAVANQPGQIVIEGNATFHQSVIQIESHPPFLLRILVNPETNIIITAYRTSKINKYWRNA
jgi:hypothetical protein